MCVSERERQHITSRIQYMTSRNFSSLYFKKNLFIYFCLRWVFVAARRLFSSCGEWGLLFVAVRGLLIAVASLVAEHGL